MFMQTIILNAKRMSEDNVYRSVNKNKGLWWTWKIINIYRALTAITNCTTNTSHKSQRIDNAYLSQVGQH